MAKPGLLVDSGALIALANRRETANQAVNRVLGDFFGELVTIRTKNGLRPQGDGLSRLAVPKLYEYFGLIVMFYANEHEPVHVHGKFQGRESRAEIILVNGAITGIRYAGTVGRAPLEPNEMRFFQEIVTVKADEIVFKWIDFFVLHKSVTPEHITRRLK